MNFFTLVACKDGRQKDEQWPASIEVRSNAERQSPSCKESALSGPYTEIALVLIHFMHFGVSCCQLKQIVVALIDCNYKALI